MLLPREAAEPVDARAAAAAARLELPGPPDAHRSLATPQFALTLRDAQFHHDCVDCAEARRSMFENYIPFWNVTDVRCCLCIRSVVLR